MFVYIHKVEFHINRFNISFDLFRQEVNYVTM